MYGFFVRRDEKKVVFVYGCLLAEVRLYNIFEVPIYSSMYTVIVWIKYNQTCFAFWKVLSLWNLAFYLLIFWVLREGVSYWSIVFYFLGSPRHIFGFWFLPSFNHHHHLKSPRPPGGGGGAARPQPCVQRLQCLNYLSFVLWSKIVGIVINHW